MFDPFIYQALPIRVVFGDGKLSELPTEVERLGGQRALILSTPEQAAQAQEAIELLGKLACGTFSEAAMHTPVEVTERALACVQDKRADCLVAIGGGSTIGLGKALALRTGLPQVAIPSTYAGSEVTPILGETKDGVKATQRTLDVLPETVIYDVSLTLTLPATLSANSGLNAIAHAAEALYARDGNPIITLLAEEGIAALVQALPDIIQEPHARKARIKAQYGAWLCAICLGSVSMSLHHKLCHVLGGTFNLPHAETHAVVLPYALKFNAGALPAESCERLKAALKSTDIPAAIRTLSERIGTPTSLQTLGMPFDGIDYAASLAVKNPYWNPRAFDRETIRDVIAQAWKGDWPADFGAA